MEIQFRRAVTRDYPALVRIAATNARDNPDAIARGRGFLTGHFDVTKFAAFDASLGIWVADADGRAVGFMCAATCAFAEQVPILATMFEACREARLGHLPLAGLRRFTYGPVCIAPAWQGHGLLKPMFANLKDQLRDRFDAGVLFIDRANPHSLAAHEHGLGMSRVAEFEFKGRGYHVLAFRCAQPEAPGARPATSTVR